FKLETKWKEKKDSGDYTKKMEARKAAKQAVESMAEQMREEKQNSDKDMQTITLKLGSGKKLSQKEMEYLSKKNPQLYQKAKQIEAEKEKYKEELKRCKTKEEVQRLKASYVGEALSKVNSIVNNPHIPEGKKLELVMEIHAKVCAVVETEKEFVESGEYAKLQTEAERNEELKEKAEAEEIKPEEEVSEEEAEEIKQEEEVSEEEETKAGTGSEAVNEVEAVAGKEKETETEMEPQNPAEGGTLSVKKENNVPSEHIKYRENAEAGFNEAGSELKEFENISDFMTWGAKLKHRYESRA
ncbi:MAG: hypothetical protein ACI4LO_02430, partial [Anaerovoracaceae bacterium]